MFGQAPYVINTMLTYSSTKLGITATISYNLQGRKLVIISDVTKPDIYELPRHLLDFKISKTINKHFNTSLKVFDILNSSVIRAYNDASGEDNLIYSQYKYGTNFTLSLSYKL